MDEVAKARSFVDLITVGLSSLPHRPYSHTLTLLLIDIGSIGWLFLKESHFQQEETKMWEVQRG